MNASSPNITITAIHSSSKIKEIPRFVFPVLPPLLSLRRTLPRAPFASSLRSSDRGSRAGPENAAMTFDEVSLERSKGFVQALQELKNIRPQLYSAAEYCEKSYLLSEQKQMVLDNLKEYAVRALVNAVDHLGTVAYKLTDLAEQQSSDISTVELKISCLSQQILTCQTFTNNEGLRQQQLFPTATRHKKRYTFPCSISKRVESSSKLQKDNTQCHVQARPVHTSGIPAPKTLSWHLASDHNTAPSRHSRTQLRDEDSANVTSDSLHPLASEEESIAPIPLSSHLHAAKGYPPIDVVSGTFCVKDPLESSKPLAGFKAFDDQRRRDISHPSRSKSILSVFFLRNKSFKPKRVSVS